MTIKLKKIPQAMRAILGRGGDRRTSAAAAARAVPGRMEVRAEAGDDQAELLIYGNIGESWWEDTVTAKSVVDELGDISASTIVVRINSYGGAVSDGVAIYNALRRKASEGATIDVHIDGIAASIASLIAMAGDTITMPDNTLMMLHAPWGFAYGNSAELREYADVLDTFGKAMATSYARKSGRPASEFEALWASGKDYWYTAAEAVDAGLADEAVDAEAPEEAEEDAAASAAALQRLSARAPQHIAAQLDALLHPRDSHATAAAAAHPTPRSPAAAGTTSPAVSGIHEDIDMPNPTRTAAAEPAANPQNAESPIAALQARNAEIRAIATPHLGHPDVRSYYDEVIAGADPEVTADDVSRRILALIGQGREPMNGNAAVAAGDDDRDKKRQAMALAIDSRLGVTRAAGDNPFRGHTMFELSRACAEAAGVNTRGMDRMEIVASSFTHSTSDFPLLLSDVAHKSLKRGYEESPEVFPLFTRPVTLTDFKPTSLAGLGRFSNLDIVPEGSEYKYGTFNESGSPLRLVTYGKMFSITRQAVINDDLNALADVPRKMGQAAKRTLGNAVFSIFTSNPVMSDGKALFHADHNNLVNPGSAISTTTVDGMRVLMATQKDAAGNVVRVPLKFLVVPVGLGGLARTVLESQFEVSGSKNNTTPNIVRNTFEVIEDPRLDAADPAAWYGVADPTFYDGIVVGYLDGRQEPYLESKQGWNVDGTEWKVRLDAAAAAVDHIALAKNPGA
ncbi:ClpP-like prohead protease/major capsid protein fusion protein [Marilutibacter spongiae]|nr:ClpP-like prohead protease/major capsid protein fusion protein [Lysobacter spongiae]